MKKHALIVPLILTLFFAAWGASPATAEPIPGITQTPQYKMLVGAVNDLEGQRNVPATPARKTSYRRTLDNKTGAAKSQVKSLFVRRSSRVKSRDDAAQQRQIRNILKNQRNQVDALQALKASKLADAQDDYQASLNRINSRYAPRLDPLVNQRTVLKRQLARTTRPARRQQILDAITTVQAKINRIADGQQVATQVATTGYQARVGAVNDTFAARIRTVQSRGSQLVLQANRAWKATYQADFARLKERRTDEFSLVSRLNERGSGYISSMPPKN